LKIYQTSERKLNIHETKFINVFGELYEKRGQNRFLGKLWSLLFLKAHSPEQGLDQQEIAEYLGRSVSTVSRQLKMLVKLQLVDFIDDSSQEVNQQRYSPRKFYSRRKYYMKTNFQKIISGSIKAMIANSMWFKEKLDSLKIRVQNDPEDNEEIQKNLIDHIDDIDERVKLLNNVWYQFIEEGKDLF
jgi:DNA-binding transcriptional regulator GbsR (MarR family)